MPFLRRLQQRSGYYLITARRGNPRPCLRLCCYLGTRLTSLLGGGIQAAHWPGANTTTADGRGASMAPGTLQKVGSLVIIHPSEGPAFPCHCKCVQRCRSSLGLSMSWDPMWASRALGSQHPTLKLLTWWGQTTSVLWLTVLTSQLFCWSTHFSYSWTFKK